MPAISLRWRRTLEIGFWLVVVVLNGVFNSVDSMLDHPELPGWMPWVWESSSAVLVLGLLPAVVAFERRWPIQFDNWPRRSLLHVAASVVFSVIHVSGMVVLRQWAYAMAGRHYDFSPWWLNFSYEYLKDVRAYAVIVATLMLYRLWCLRRQGEAKLLAAPEEGLPLEPVERPDRFLVRKLGKEFLLAAREIEWLQASGNYVNLRVRGRDYPLRATMAGIEARLDPARFLRVHRGYFINLDYLAEIEPLDTGDARLHLRDGAQIPCSRRYRTALRERFGATAAATG